MRLKDFILVGVFATAASAGLKRDINPVTPTLIARNDSGAIVTSTEREVSTSIITITSCSSNKCSTRTHTTGITKVTTITSGVTTIYTTYCPLSSTESSQTSSPSTPASISYKSLDSTLSTTNSESLITSSPITSVPVKYSSAPCEKSSQRTSVTSSSETMPTTSSGISVSAPASSTFNDTSTSATSITKPSNISLLSSSIADTSSIIISRSETGESSSSKTSDYSIIIPSQSTSLSSRSSSSTHLRSPSSVQYSSLNNSTTDTASLKRSDQTPVIKTSTDRIELSKIITITHCKNEKCSESSATATRGLTTVTISGITTFYTTWCPLSSSAIQSSTSDKKSSLESTDITSEFSLLSSSLEISSPAVMSSEQNYHTSSDNQKCSAQSCYTSVSESLPTASSISATKSLSKLESTIKSSSSNFMSETNTSVSSLSSAIAEISTISAKMSSSFTSRGNSAPTSSGRVSISSTISSMTSVNTGDITSLSPRTITSSEHETTLITSTVCSSGSCVSKSSTAIKKSITTLISGTTTSYFTWCPLSSSEKSSESIEVHSSQGSVSRKSQQKLTTVETSLPSISSSTSSYKSLVETGSGGKSSLSTSSDTVEISRTLMTSHTTYITISRCSATSCHSAVIPATLGISTTTMNGMVTSYTTFCPLSSVDASSDYSRSVEQSELQHTTLFDLIPISDSNEAPTSSEVTVIGETTSFSDVSDHSLSTHYKISSEFSQGTDKFSLNALSGSSSVKSSSLSSARAPRHSQQPSTLSQSRKETQNLYTRFVSEPQPSSKLTSHSEVLLVTSTVVSLFPKTPVDSQSSINPSVTKEATYSSLEPYKPSNNSTLLPQREPSEWGSSLSKASGTSSASSTWKHSVTSSIRFISQIPNEGSSGKSKGWMSLIVLILVSFI